MPSEMMAMRMNVFWGEQMASLSIWTWSQSEIHYLFARERYLLKWNNRRSRLECIHFSFTFFSSPRFICSLSFLIPWHSSSSFWILIYPSPCSILLNSLIFFIVYLCFSCISLWNRSLALIWVELQALSLLLWVYCFVRLIERPWPEGFLKATLLLSYCSSTNPLLVTLQQQFC